MTDENTNQLIKPTVQDVLDRLQAVDDKSVPFEVMMWDAEGFSLDYSSIELQELVTTDGAPSSVSLDITFTGEVRQSWPKDEDSDESYAEYEEKHWPQNQILVEGVPVNPVLRDGFDATNNDDRDDGEINDWWDRPFIRIYTWFDMATSYSDYLNRIKDLENVEPDSREQYDQGQNDFRKKWFESWPSGVRYDVRCLDGGAWDRSTNWAQVGDFREALEIAKTGKYFQE